MRFVCVFCVFVCVCVLVCVLCVFCVYVCVFVSVLCLCVFLCLFCVCICVRFVCVFCVFVCVCVLVLFLFYLNVSGMHLRSCLSYRLPGLSSASGGSIALVPPWVTNSYFFAGNRKAELKPTTFS